LKLQDCIRIKNLFGDDQLIVKIGYSILTLDESCSCFTCNLTDYIGGCNFRHDLWYICFAVASIQDACLGTCSAILTIPFL